MPSYRVRAQSHEKKNQEQANISSSQILMGSHHNLVNFEKEQQTLS